MNAPRYAAAVSKPALSLFLLLVFSAVFLSGLGLHSQQQPAPPAGEDKAERSRRMSREAEAKGLAEPFKGITTSSGSVVPDLFRIASTGVSTAFVRDAATAFLNSLTPEQRARTAFPVDDPEWRKWMNQ